VIHRLFKMEGAANDFLVGTGLWADRLADDRDLVVRLCSRNRGIGADGVLSVRVTGSDRVVVGHRNADGSATAFCANGTRCAARVAVEVLGISSTLEVETGWALIRARVREDAVSLELPPPPSAARRLDLDPAPGPSWLIEVGVPHLVVEVATGLETLDLPPIAAPLRRHPGLGPGGANVHLVTRPHDAQVEVRSWERGVEGETCACGSGIVAAALVMMGRHGGSRLRCATRGGDTLEVEALGEPSLCASRLTGPARHIAEVRPAPELMG
jgi:diaminopimelate epimerase